MLSGVLRMPSDKSIGHRAMIANSVAAGAATVHLAAPGADLFSTIACLQALGIGVEVTRSSAGADVRIVGSPELPTGMRHLDCGNSGTTMRLLAGLMAARDGSTVLDGDASLRRRPMERVADPLRAMGASVTTSPDGCAPLRIDGRRPLRGMRHRLDVASAQLLATVVLAGLAADGDIEVELPAPVRDHTERLLAWMGASIGRIDERRTVLHAPATLTARSLAVPGDPSSAAAWMVAAAIRPGAEIRLVGLCVNPSRLALVDVLREMGAAIDVEQSEASAGKPEGPEPVGDVVVRGTGRLRPIQLAGARVAALIDELPLLAIAMAAADGTSELRGAGELRAKESDRIASVVTGLAAIGARVEELNDGWQVGAGRPVAAHIETHGDHRIAIAFAIAAAAGVGGDVLLDNADCVAVSYPTFWDDLAAASAATGALA
ncbi:MAG TPA: 3-phosphoshikimate 1-carboxyvinyltransferase [Candidatus Limnocylindrales bacterium]|nr:3-phosphoshikimate 1-carboxyvinyltransferase [Candidatus Limnocylindrales bacterium]